MASEHASGEREPLDHAVEITEKVGVTDEVQAEIPGWLEANRVELDKGTGKNATSGAGALSGDATASPGALEVNSTFPDAVPIVEWDSWSSYSSQAKDEINRQGKQFHASFYKKLKPKGLVYLVANPFERTPENLQRGAQAELARRNAKSMQRSSIVLGIIAAFFGLFTAVQVVGSIRGWW